jgi:hypothetical protein
MGGYMPDINDHTFEIRYKPNPKVLDYRGSWAEAISDHMKLPDWRILENRIDIYDEKVGERAFVGFRNAGFVTRNTPTKNYFPEKTIKFFRYVLNLDGFGKSLFVERIGVRSRFCRKYEGAFEELREKYTTKYLSLTETAKKIIDAKLVDIGGPRKARGQVLILDIPIMAQFSRRNLPGPERERNAPIQRIPHPPPGSGEFKTYLIIQEKSSIILPVRKEGRYADTHNDPNVFQGAGGYPGRNP